MLFPCGGPPEPAARPDMPKLTTAEKQVARIRALEAEINRLRREGERNLRLASTDSLTGLKNRRAIEGREHGWYVLADLDHFKAAQDAHPKGHAHGDRILKEFAGWLAQNVRQDDYLAVRLGGDEFAVHVDTKWGAMRVRDAIREWRSKIDEQVTASAGLGADLAAADAALYLHKERRRAGK